MEVEMAIIFAVVTGFLVIAMGMALFSEFRWKRSVEERIKALEEKIQEPSAPVAVERNTPPEPLRRLSSRPPPAPPVGKGRSTT